MEQIENSVKTFIVENFLFTSNLDALKNDASFLEQGIVDSTGILEIVSFVEEKFGIKIEDGEIIPENLDSIYRLVSFIKSKNE